MLNAGHWAAQTCRDLSCTEFPPPIVLGRCPRKREKVHVQGIAKLIELAETVLQIKEPGLEHRGCLAFYCGYIRMGEFLEVLCI